MIIVAVEFRGDLNFVLEVGKPGGAAFGLLSRARKECSMSQPHEYDSLLFLIPSRKSFADPLLRLATDGSGVARRGAGWVAVPFDRHGRFAFQVDFTSQSAAGRKISVSWIHSGHPAHNRFTRYEIGCAFRYGAYWGKVFSRGRSLPFAEIWRSSGQIADGS